jgi:hypothetical protein
VLLVREVGLRRVRARAGLAGVTVRARDELAAVRDRVDDGAEGALLLDANSTRRWCRRSSPKRFVVIDTHRVTKRTMR